MGTSSHTGGRLIERRSSAAMAMAAGTMADVEAEHIADRAKDFEYRCYKGRLGKRGRLSELLRIRLRPKQVENVPISTASDGLLLTITTLRAGLSRDYLDENGSDNRQSRVRPAPPGSRPTASPPCRIAPKASPI